MKSKEMTYSDWYKVIDKLDDKRKEEFKNALEVLRTWDDFKDAFAWTGIFTLLTMITFEGRLDGRNKFK